MFQLNGIFSQEIVNPISQNNLFITCQCLARLVWYVPDNDLQTFRGFSEYIISRGDTFCQCQYLSTPAHNSWVLLKIRYFHLMYQYTQVYVVFVSAFLQS